MSPLTLLDESNDPHMPAATLHALPRRWIWYHHRERGWRYGLLSQLHRVSAGVCGMLLQIILGAEPDYAAGGYPRKSGETCKGLVPEVS